MNKTLLSIIFISFFGDCINTKSNNLKTSKDAICINESDSFHNCKTFELNLVKGKLLIDNDGKYVTYNRLKGKIKVDNNCDLTSSQFIEIDDRLILFNNYDCGPEGYNDINCINMETCKTLWTINDYFGFTPRFFEIENDIIIPGHYTIGRFNLMNGKTLWLLNIGEKYKFSRIENCSIEGNELKITGATHSLDSKEGWKLIDLTVDLTTGLKK